VQQVFIQTGLLTLRCKIPRVTESYDNTWNNVAALNDRTNLLMSGHTMFDLDQDTLTALTSNSVLVVTASRFAKVQNSLATMRPKEYEVLKKLGMNYLVPMISRETNRCIGKGSFGSVSIVRRRSDGEVLMGSTWPYLLVLISV
jgi:hypothetical protein